MKTIGFYHVAMMNDWLQLFNHQITRLTKSGLLSSTHHLYITALGPNEELNKLSVLDKKITITHHPDLEKYEHPTLRQLSMLSKNDDFLCYYFHTKGISITDEEKYNRNHARTFTPLKAVQNNAKHWRLFMEYFIMNKWRKTITYLKEYDCVGVNWFNDPFRHFSGNFWWSKSEYIRKLKDVATFPAVSATCFPSPITKWRCRAEEWLGQRPEVKVKCLSNLIASYWQAPLPRDYINIHNS